MPHERVLPSSPSLPHGVELSGPYHPRWAEVLTPQALSFAASLERHFGPMRERLLALREQRQARLDQGEQPDFLRETAALRERDWKVAPAPADLADRRVEITGPIDRKMIINALNSGAQVFMADAEDSNAPTWSNVVEGQLNLRHAVRRTIEFVQPDTGKRYALAERTAVLMFRPRGWHLEERHVLVDGEPISASLFDFGMYFFHNARELVSRGSGPYFYLPKLESHREARLWNEVFVFAECELGLTPGTIRATVLIETILAAFEMDEILWELREHSAGLNCGRWDYIFSFIKKFRAHKSCVLPDRALVGMTEHFLKSYSQLLVRTCHRRGAHAMGGMAAQIPIKGDPVRNAAAIAKVRADKEREARDGHDGTWVAHPGLVETARSAFDAEFSGLNQIESKPRADVRVTAADLLRVPAGAVTEAGLRQNVNIGVQYLASWLSGTGCVPLCDLMEDAATAEISRAQVWQWIRHRELFDDGRTIDPALFQRIVHEELEGLRRELGEQRFAGGRYADARELFERLSLAADFAEFLTLPAYALLTATSAIRPLAPTHELPDTTTTP